jgi:hypothetical protein
MIAALAELRYCDQFGYLFVPVFVICRSPVPSRCIV